MREGRQEVGMDGQAPGPSYGAGSIIVFSGLDAVRRNPAMYVGSTGTAGLHQLVFELIDNAVDEALAGYGEEITVTLHEDGSCSVADTGRGIPIDIHPELGLPACEVVLTTMHSGGKFEGSAYPRSAGLHGVGLSCVNALSEWLTLEVTQGGSRHRQQFGRGIATKALEPVGAWPGTGTMIRFLPDATVLDEVGFDADVIAGRLEELGYLLPGMRLRMADERTGTSQSFAFEGGIAALLGHRAQHATPVHAEQVRIAATTDATSFELAFWWTENYTESVWGYVNTLRVDQGDHVAGLRAALSRVVLACAVEGNLLDSVQGQGIATADILEGLTAVVAVSTQSPKFDGQTKRRLAAPEVGEFVESAVALEFSKLLSSDEELVGRIVGRVVDASRSRLAARLAGRTARFQRRSIDIDYDAYREQFGIRSRDWHDSCTWLTDEGLLARHAELCDVAPDARMLDVCCGSGVVGAAFKGRIAESIGLDITPEMVSLASARLDEVHEGTVYDLPFPDASFDIVVNREVLHLLPQPENPLAEIYRVLKPGGQFIVGQIVPYTDADAFWMFRIFKKKQPLLCQMFSEGEFRQLLLGAGFGNTRMEEYFLWESIDRWINTYETAPVHRQEIYRLFYEAPREVRAVHPFEVDADGSVRDCWRWCVYSVRKPL